MKIVNFDVIDALKDNVELRKYAKPLFDYTLKTSGDTTTLTAKYPRNNDIFIERNYWIDYIRFYAVGSGTLKINNVYLISFFNNKFKNVEFKSKSATIDKNGFIDVNIGLQSDGFAIDIESTGIDYLYLRYNGELFDYNEAVMKEYAKIRSISFEK